MDLMAITQAPGNVDQSVDASLRWLAKQRFGRWMLFFDNADDVQLKLKNFFPASTSGNILVTTRNQELRLCAKGSNENVRDMDQEDATKLLLRLSHAEETDENRVLAVQIVQVFTFILRLGNAVKHHDTGTPSLRFGSLSSRRLHSLSFIITHLSKTLPT